ncbi:hypothetical protein CK215_15035 [Mesorhizobium sp. WSM3864]|nr:hypothetical protein CK215_15035 [Mesorhizobium sp. WSM3864]
MSLSAPEPPSTVSKPLPPSSVSAPDPPFRRSLPAPPDRMSSPLPPTRLSLLLVPTVVAIFHPPGRRAPRLLVGRPRRLTTPCRRIGAQSDGERKGSECHATRRNPTVRP